MTMGPEPMSIIFSISVRLGMEFLVNAKSVGRTTARRYGLARGYRMGLRAVRMRVPLRRVRIGLIPIRTNLAADLVRTTR